MPILFVDLLFLYLSTSYRSLLCSLPFTIFAKEEKRQIFERTHHGPTSVEMVIKGDASGVYLVWLGLWRVNATDDNCIQATTISSKIWRQKSAFNGIPRRLEFRSFCRITGHRSPRLLSLLSIMPRQEQWFCDLRHCPGKTLGGGGQSSIRFSATLPHKFIPQVPSLQVTK